MPVYYLDPFKYLLGALVSFTTWNEEVVCTDSEYGYFDPPDGVTCGSYLSDFMQQATGYLDNPVFPAIFNPDIYAYKSQEATTDCRYCGYKNGQEYLADLNLPKQVYAWRDVMITLWVFLSSNQKTFG
jgi:ATP-binding cassette subfamily G (WHITE) protein 2 (SNQ2)